MSKLIYALSKAGLELAYGPTSSYAKAMTATDNPIYNSVAFTTDGYLYTHGKYFRIIPDAGTSSITTPVAASAGSVTLKDTNGVALGTIDVGVTSVTASGVLTAGALTSGAIAITHNIVSAGFGAAVGGDATTASVAVPKFTVDDYGHITVKGTSTANLDYVYVAADITTNNDYRVMLGSTTSALETIRLTKASTLKFNPSTGTLTASKYIGALNYNFSITLNNAAATIFDNTANRTLTFFAPSASGTTGTKTYLTPTTNGAPVWQEADTMVTQNSTNLVTSNAVYNAVNAAVATADAMVYKGTIDATTAALPTANKGDTYKVSVAGTFNGTKSVEVGDMLICNTDGTTTVAYASITAGSWTNWDVVQTNLVSTTLGLNLLNFTNPGAISFIRINADNTVTAQPAANFKADLSLNNVENTALSTWAGTTNITTLGTIATGTWNATAIAANKGGTGQTAYTVGDILYASSPSVLSKLAGNTTAGKQYLSQTGTGSASAAPAWATIAGSDITGAALTKTDDTNVTLTLGGTPATSLLRAATITVGWNGTLAATRGGTGYGTYTAGDMLYANSPTTLAKIAKPATNGFILKYNTLTDTPYWAADIDTDTHWTANLYVGATGAASNAATVNGATYLKLWENSTSRANLLITGSGATSVASDANGNITISSVNSWRVVNAYAWTSAAPAVLSLESIGAANLKFGDEFIWNSTASELKLGWAEVANNGDITYSV